MAYALILHIIFTMMNSVKIHKKSIAVIVALIIVCALCICGYQYIKTTATIQTFTGTITAVQGCSEYIGVGGDSCTWVVAGNKVIYEWGTNLDSMNNRPIITGLNPDDGKRDIGKMLRYAPKRLATRATGYKIHRTTSS